MKRQILIFLVSLLFAIPCLAKPQTASERLSQAVEHLLQHIEKSGLVFIRNGSEHDAMAAAAHLRGKFDNLKNSINSPEQFIEKAATKSSMTGNPYMVKFADGSSKKLSDWLRTELKNYKDALKKGG